MGFILGPANEICLHFRPRANTPRALRLAARYQGRNREEHLVENVEGEEISSSEDRSVGLQPSAFTTAKSSKDAAAKAIAEGLSVYHRNFHVSSGLGGLSSFGSIYLSGDEFEAWGNKKPFPPAEEMANYRRTIADGFPHWSKLQHRTP